MFVKIIDHTGEEVPFLRFKADMRARVMEYERFLVLDGKKTNVKQKIRCNIKSRKLESDVLIYSVTGNGVSEEYCDSAPSSFNVPSAKEQAPKAETVAPNRTTRRSNKK